MRAGRLRHRVTIERNTNSTPNDNGQVKPNWQTVYTRWAAIRPLRGKEYEEAHQMKAIETHEITLRYVPITRKDRIRYGSRIFNIESVINVGERNKELLCRCVEEA